MVSIIWFPHPEKPRETKGNHTTQLHITRIDIEIDEMTVTIVAVFFSYTPYVRGKMTEDWP